MLKLLCHPNTPAKEISSVDVDVELAPNGKLWMRYHVEGKLDKIELAAPHEPRRTDYLWKHTCFETFITRADQSNYIEFNFCPSKRWAAYQFSDYRENAGDLPMTAPPAIQSDAGNGHFAIEVELMLPEGWRNGEMLMGITTIIEEVSGNLSYWALKHPGETQEFHDRDCFIHKLRAAKPE